MEVEKQRVARGGKNIIFRRGGGINIVFGPKYRPLAVSVGFFSNFFFMRFKMATDSLMG